MKQLILVRHAKSSWKDSSIEDHDRPLNKRGEREAPYMAKVLSKRKITPDIIVSSTAERAWTTAREFAKKLDYKKKDIVREKELYMADVDDMLQYVKDINDKHSVVMLVGHNPGLTSFANLLSKDSIDNIPTCGVYALQFDIESWKDVGAEKGKVTFFEYPKMYFKDSED